MKNEIDILRELNDLVLKEVGLDIDRYYNVVDQDTGIQLQINGKLIKYYFGSEMGSYLTSDEKILDVGHDPYLMNFLVSYYIEKIKEEDEDLYIFSYHSIYDKIINKSALEFKGSINLKTRFYTMDALKFIEGLFRLTGSDIDLTEYDEALSFYEKQKENKRR